MTTVHIVGGGFTGISTAIRATQLGCTPTLYDERKYTGGILNDILVDNDWFFRSCHYISSSAYLLANAPNALLRRIPHYGYSYTDLWAVPVSSKDFAGPIYPYPLSEDLLTNTSFNHNSLLDRINGYPYDITQKLTYWLHSINIDPASIHSYCANALQVSRIFPAATDLGLLQSLKATYHSIDQLYGIPRQHLGLDKAYSFLPTAGYNNYFHQTLQYIETLGVTLKLGTFVQASSLIDTLSNDLDSLIAWTGNPTLPLSLLDDIKIKSIPWHRQVLTTYITTNHSSFPFYIQVYSLESPITRIFVYDNKCSIEISCKRVGSLSTILDFAKHILSFFDPYLCMSEMSAHLSPDIQYPFVSPTDFSKLSNSSLLSNSRRFLNCGWHLYGRDLKVNHTIQQLESLV